MRRQEHGKPGDWQETQFSTQSEALGWLSSYVGEPGFVAHAARPSGWRHGYWYTITARTKQ